MSRQTTFDLERSSTLITPPQVPLPSYQFPAEIFPFRLRSEHGISLAFTDLVARENCSDTPDRRRESFATPGLLADL